MQRRPAAVRLREVMRFRYRSAALRQVIYTLSLGTGSGTATIAKASTQIMLAPSAATVAYGATVTLTNATAGPHRNVSPVLWGILLLPFALSLRRAGKRISECGRTLLLAACLMPGLEAWGQTSSIAEHTPPVLDVSVTYTPCWRMRLPAMASINARNLHFVTVRVTDRDRGAYIPLLVESLACVG
jgi:hypothetical protein